MVWPSPLRTPKAAMWEYWYHGSIAGLKCGGTGFGSRAVEGVARVHPRSAINMWRGRVRGSAPIPLPLAHTDPESF